MISHVLGSLGQPTYLYRGIDSGGNTIEFLLSPYRDVTTAKACLQLAIAQAGRIQPRVIDVDGIQRTRRRWRI